jgi:hypothetical protein
MQWSDARKWRPQKMPPCRPEFSTPVNVPRPTRMLAVAASAAVLAPQHSRARTRTRRRRRKRALGSAWAFLLRVFLVYGTVLIRGRM